MIAKYISQRKKSNKTKHKNSYVRFIREKKQNHLNILSVKKKSQAIKGFEKQFGQTYLEKLRT